MDDRKLIELAAKAAGIFDEWPAPDYEVQWNGGGLWCSGEGEGVLWNPLTDDGDAFRLAVKLKITPHFDLVDMEVIAKTDHIGDGTGFKCLEMINGVDDYAATRRAIVRAAAAIAEQQRQGGV